MSPPLVAVIVPTHNRVHVLPATIASILGQRDVEVRLIVVDDGSSDGTATYLRGLDDPRVEVVRHAEPRRLPGARNAGLERVPSGWVAFCDDDDLWAPTKLARQVQALEATGARWSCTGVVLVDVDLEPIGHHRVPGGDILPSLLTSNTVPAGGSSVVADAGLVHHVGGFDEQLRSSEDWDLWIRLAQHSDVVSVDAPLLAYRIWGGTMSTDVDRMRESRRLVLENYADIAARLGVEPAPFDPERHLAKQLLRAGAGRQAAAVYLSLVARSRRPSQLSRALLALMAPKLTDRVGTRRSRRAIPLEWQAEAEAWLAPKRPAALAG